MQHSPAYLAQEKAAYRTLLGMGVTLGEPVVLSARQRQFGHMMCSFHLVETATGEDIDGGSASTLLNYLSDGTYGVAPGACTLHPCTNS